MSVARVESVLRRAVDASNHHRDLPIALPRSKVLLEAGVADLTLKSCTS